MQIDIPGSEGNTKAMLQGQKQRGAFTQPRGLIENGEEDSDDDRFVLISAPNVRQETRCQIKHHVRKLEEAFSPRVSKQTRAQEDVTEIGTLLTGEAKLLQGSVSGRRLGVTDKHSRGGGGKRAPQPIHHDRTPPIP
jgi:hypothetical protein